MKTKLTLLLMLLLTTAWEARAEKVGYTVLSEDGKTLTYYYDDAQAEKVGMVKGLGYHDNAITKVIFDESFAEARPTSTSNWFRGMIALQDIEGMENLNTSSVTNMSTMFYRCSGLTSLDLSHFDTSNVTNMGSMFYQCFKLASLNVSHFDTSNVTSMDGMFYDCSDLAILDVSHFDTSKVTDMSSMFYHCQSLTSLDVSHFDTSNVTSMLAMFYGCSKLTSLDVSHFDTSDVTAMFMMFYDCSRLTSLDVSHFDTSKVMNMSYLFYLCSSLTSLDVSHFDTSNVTSMGNMFARCRNLTNLDVSNFDMSKVEDTNNMFENCSSLETLSISSSMSNISEDACTGVGTAETPCTLVAPEGFDYGVDTTGDYFQWKSGYFKASAPETPEKEGYTVLSGDGKTLTYYYDAAQAEKVGTIKELGYNDETITQVIFDESFAEARPTSTSKWFYYMTSLRKIVGMEYLNTSDVTSMANMFYRCNRLTSLDVSHFDTSNVTSMVGMFSCCYNLTSLDVSHFDTSNVIDMSSMFDCCGNRLTSLDVSHFDTSNVTNMAFMFDYCNHLTSLDVSNFDMSKVEDAQSMFHNCIALETLSISSSMSNISENACEGVGKAEAPCLLVAPEGFDYGVDTTGDYFLWKSGYFKRQTDEKEGYTVLSEDGKTLTYYYDAAKADKVGTVKELGYNDSAITKIIFDESFAEARPTSIRFWFSYMTALQEIVGIENLNTSNVTSMVSMFAGCRSLTSLDVSHFDTSNVTDMTFMFSGCRSLTSLDVSHFDTSNVTIMRALFGDCSSLTSLDVSHFDTSNVTIMRDMFGGCSNLTSLDLSHFDTSNVTDMTNLFAYCSSLTSLDLSHFDTSNVTSMGGMFYECSNLKSLDLSSFDTSNLTYTSLMFQNCSSLTSLDLSHFDTSNVTNMEQMFMGCSSLTSLDVSHFDTSNVTDMDFMFSGCSSLTSLDISNFDLSNVKTTRLMFYNSTSLKELSVSSSMSNISDDACTGVGTAEAPCLLVAPEGFDYGVDTTGDYFLWKSGYFKVEDAGAPVIAELTLDENAGNEIPENGTLVQTVNTMRTLVGGVWNTLCLPFTVTAEAMAEESHPLHGATIMTLTDALFDVADQAQHLMFSQESEIKAGMPYVVKVPADVVNPTFSNVTIEAQEPVATQVGDWRMVGIYSPYTFTAADNGIFFLTSGNKFSYVAQPGTMKGMRAYFALDTAADYANIVVCFDEATGISQVSVSPAADDKVYDLQGRPLNHAPAHGVYIVNGKKIVK